MEARGLTIERFVDALLDLVNQRLNDSAAQGDVPEEKIGPILQELRQRLLQDLGGPHTVPSTSIGPESSRWSDLAVTTDLPFSLQEVATTLGILPEKLRGLLSRGHTVAEVAETFDVSLEDSVNARVASLKAKLAGLVETGNLSEKAARQALEQAREELEHEVDTAWEALEEQHQAGWESLDAEQRVAWAALDEKYWAAWESLDAENQATWEALDRERQSTWAALDTEHQAAWEALEVEQQAARQALDKVQQTA